MKYILNEDEVERILQHWNGTPANSYRGSRYGQSHNRVLFQPMSEDSADRILDKITTDIPLFANLDSELLQILSEDLGNDKKRIHIAVGEVVIPIATTDTSNYTGDTFHPDAQ